MGTEVRPLGGSATARRGPRAAAETGRPCAEGAVGYTPWVAMLEVVRRLVGTLNARPPRARPARGATVILTFSPMASSSVALYAPIKT
jgi:hypothetical protein